MFLLTNVTRIQDVPAGHVPKGEATKGSEVVCAVISHCIIILNNITINYYHILGISLYFTFC